MLSFCWSVLLSLFPLLSPVCQESCGERSSGRRGFYCEHGRKYSGCVGSEASFKVTWRRLIEEGFSVRYLCKVSVLKALNLYLVVFVDHWASFFPQTQIFKAVGVRFRKRKKKNLWDVVTVVSYCAFEWKCCPHHMPKNSPTLAFT